MAAGDIFNARLTVTGTRATLDALVGGAPKTYSYISLRPTIGSVAIGNGSVTQGNGFMLAPHKEYVIDAASIGANINLIGPGTVDFFGITSA